MRTRNIVFLVLIALVMMGMLIPMLSETSNVFSSYTNFEAAKASQTDVHVVGEWVMREQTEQQVDGFIFYLKDSTNYVQQVVYNDPKPVNFESAEKVVVIGRYEGEIFRAKKILMKCPSKYEENSVSGTEQAAVLRN